MNSKIKDLLFFSLILLTGLAFTYLRQPSAFHPPQLFAEDGVIWITHAYEEDFKDIVLRPEAGYNNIVARITAEIAILAGLKHAPKAFFIVALIIHLLPVLLIFTKRLSDVFPDLKTKVVIALIYLALPDVSDLHLTFSNSQWRFSFVLFLVFIAQKPKERIVSTLDLLVIAVGSLMGPFSIFLLPGAVLYAYFQKVRFTTYKLMILAIGALIQLFAIVSSMGVRPGILEIGASLEGFTRIIAGKLFASTLFGHTGYSWLYAQPWWGLSLTLSLTILTSIIFAYGFIRGSRELKLFIFFTAIASASALIKPTVGMHAPAWLIIENPDTAPRYWLGIHLAFILVLGFLAMNSSKINLSFITHTSRFLLCLLPIGIYLDWRLKDLTPLPYKQACKLFKKSPVGTIGHFPIQPPGYEFRLKKK